MGALEWVNLVLAAAIFVAACCAVDKIQRQTAHTVRAAVLLVLVGALGELLAPMFREAMRQAIDTCLMGGIAAFLFADRRGPFAPPRRDEPDAEHIVRQARLARLAQRVSAWISAATVAVLLAVWAGQVRADDGVRFTEAACLTLAEIVEQAADARDAKKYLAYMAVRMERRGNTPTAKAVMLAEIAKVFAGKGDSERLQFDVYSRCMTGPMGGGTKI